MRILVTGGAGFIGSNFVHYISKKYPAYKIIVVDALTYAADMDRLAGVSSKIKFHKANVCDEVAMDKLMKGVDIVAHFAAESHVDRSIANPGPFLKSNILGTEVLIRAALAHKVKRFHHVSTDEVFGTLELDSPARFNETTPYNPRSPYAASKAASDHLVRAYGETYGLPFTITNCSNNYGPYDLPARVIPVHITNALQDKPLPIYGSGKAVRDYLFVEDHCSAIDLAIHTGTPGQTYCVGGAAQRNIIQVAEAILEVTGKSKNLIQFVDDRPGHDMRYDIDASHIEQSLGWKRSVSFEEGIAKMVEWYQAHEDWWHKYRKTYDKHIAAIRSSNLYRTGQVGKVQT